MQWKLSEEQVAFRDTLRSWLEDTAGIGTVRAWLDAGDRASFWERFSADAWSGVGVGEELGGQGGGLVELALTAEELGRAAAPGAAWLATMLAVPMLAADTARVAAALTGGAAILMPSEQVPSAASALSIDVEGRITGRVARVLGGADVATYVVVAVSDGERERVLRVVDADAAGIQVTHHQLLDRSRSIADVALDSVASEPLDADPGAVLGHVTDLAGLLVAADSLGATERMLELAVDYSLQRHQFGVPIGSFQAVKHAAASIEVGVEAARSAIYYAAASVDAGHEDRSLHAAAVKAQVGAEGFRAADTALTMHGAIGYTWEHDLHLFYKRARLDSYLFGDAQVWNERIADRLSLV